MRGKVQSDEEAHNLLARPYHAPWVTAVAGQLLALHKPARQGRDLRRLLEEEPALEEVIIDGTERRLPRPPQAGRQRCSYSGRKKRPAVKNVIVVGAGRVLWYSPIRPARIHDKKVAERARLRLPAGGWMLGEVMILGWALHNYRTDQREQVLAV